jgi:hypothetical protein
MSEVGLEPTISVLERAKEVHALDGAATVIGFLQDTDTIICLPVTFTCLKKHMNKNWT